MQTEYEEPSYDRLRNEAIQRLGIEDDIRYHQDKIEAKIYELKAQYRDEWEHQDKRITFGICFSSVLGNVVNNKKYYGDKLDERFARSVIDSSVIRKFADEHDKDIYISALEDAPVDWVELNDSAIEFLESIKPVI